MDAADLTDFIFKAVLAGCGADVRAHKKAIWDAAVAMMADVLRESDPFTRERLLRGLPGELRESIIHLDQLLRPPASKLN